MMSEVLGTSRLKFKGQNLDKYDVQFIGRSRGNIDSPLTLLVFPNFVGHLGDQFRKLLFHSVRTISPIDLGGWQLASSKKNLVTAQAGWLV